MSQTVLKKEENVSRALRSLYRSHGYLPYKMSKFEPYDLYASHKDFLVGDGVITFMDTDGRLLALKPDVTLSIIKNSKDGESQKVYYNENVYRISGETKQFKEIAQVGLECLGDIGNYETYETLYLAAASLQEISQNFVLDISHLGILSAVMQSIDKGEDFYAQVMSCLAEKNAHGLLSVCNAYGVEDTAAQKLLTLLRAYGNPETVLKTLAPLCKDGKAKQAFDELSAICTLLANTPFAGRIRLDFSVVNDRKYYNGIVFKGFVEGVPEGVLSGGRYDRLMKRLGKQSGAIGFAVYLHLLEGLNPKREAFDVDTLVLYDESTCLQTLSKQAQSLQEKGVSFRIAKNGDGIRYVNALDLRGNKE